MLALVAQLGCAVALLCATLWVPSAHAYPMYNDGSGVGCVMCHNQFNGGTGVLHTLHKNTFAVATCNLCHPSGASSTPVRTYWSGPGGGYGCAGCHGQDYGETSPNNTQPKATAYGLRNLHETKDNPLDPGHLISCGGMVGCHQPGALGHPNPYPPLFGESEPPIYYDPAYSNLTDPCSSAQEDLTFDADALGLDNDGNGVADYPADPGCSAPTTSTSTTSTTSTTLPFDCAAAPVGGCVVPEKGVVLVSEKAPGKEKMKVGLKKVQSALMQSSFGDPVDGSTAYKVCIYDGSATLAGEYVVARAGDTCGSKPCWSRVSTKGYKYNDKLGSADGLLKLILLGGDAGKGKLTIVGKNKSSTMPTGVAAALGGQTSATVQVVSSDATCVSLDLTTVKKADGVLFKAGAP